jgi:hypothetical protein
MLKPMATVHMSEPELVRDIYSTLAQEQQASRSSSNRNIGPSGNPLCACQGSSPIGLHRLAKAHGEETGIATTLDPDFAADVEEIIRRRQPWNPPSWN